MKACLITRKLVSTNHHLSKDKTTIHSCCKQLKINYKSRVAAAANLVIKVANSSSFTSHSYSSPKAETKETLWVKPRACSLSLSRWLLGPAKVRRRVCQRRMSVVRIRRHVHPPQCFETTIKLALEVMVITPLPTMSTLLPR